VSEIPDNLSIYDSGWVSWLDMKRHGPASRWLRALIRAACRRLPDQPKSIHDVGCGVGTNTAFLSELFPLADVRGSDFSGTAVSVATQYCEAKKISFVHDPENRALDRTADMVCCFEVLEHLEQPERALAHMYAALGAEGSVCISTPFPSARARRDPTHINLNIPDVWQNMLTEVGFSNVVVTPIWCAPLIWRIGRYWSRAFPGGVRWSTSVLFTATK